LNETAPGILFVLQLDTMLEAVDLQVDLIDDEFDGVDTLYPEGSLSLDEPLNPYTFDQDLIVNG